MIVFTMTDQEILKELDKEINRNDLIRKLDYQFNKSFPMRKRSKAIEEKYYGSLVNDYMGIINPLDDTVVIPMASVSIKTVLNNEFIIVYSEALDFDKKTRNFILKEDPKILGKKVIIFSEFRATAKYIFDELQKDGFAQIAEIDGQSQVDRHEVIQSFSPYYNDKSSSDIENEINILIATDVLAEGLNLQDASCLINYELHWNPVRLMQRIGRVDRRRSFEIEEKLLHDHPELSKDREKAYYWNFLPPEELEKLLSLYGTVSKKTLRISKTFGIEGQKLLTPDDDYEALKEFNSQYEGETSADEEIALAYQNLLAENPDYEDVVHRLPKKMYSGKTSSTYKGYFFCYELPTKRADGSWTDGDGMYRWYMIDPASGSVIDSSYDIWKAIQCQKDEFRRLETSVDNFSVVRKTVEQFIKKNYMKAVQAPLGIKPRLVTWMQLC